ncbi:hypothetical protein A0J48_000265 [Sphaerospermopsis aphanizomenoides BCCUSP55]|nr:hypothetical protein [Sphaerospermopsis aphanizomenoides]MBK1985997.1 hypothetical protein [Sphaerospermopsis aphanizomenoides BCCUSP55]
MDVPEWLRQALGVVGLGSSDRFPVKYRLMDKWGDRLPQIRKAIALWDK